MYSITRYISLITLIPCSMFCNQTSHANERFSTIKEDEPCLANCVGENLYAKNRVSCYNSRLTNVFSNNAASPIKSSSIQYMDTVTAQLHNSYVGYLYLKQTFQNAPKQPLESFESITNNINVSNLYKRDTRVLLINPKQEICVTFMCEGGIVRTNKPKRVAVTRGIIQSISQGAIKNDEHAASAPSFTTYQLPLYSPFSNTQMEGSSPLIQNRRNSLNTIANKKS